MNSMCNKIWHEIFIINKTSNCKELVSEYVRNNLYFVFSELSLKLKLNVW